MHRSTIKILHIVVKKTMRDALSKILIEVIIFALAYAAKVDVNENNREMHIANRWLKKGHGKTKTAKPKGSTKAPIELVKKTSQPIKVIMKPHIRPLRKPSQPIKAPIEAPIQAKCGGYNLGIVSLWDTSDACRDNCLEKSAYTYIFSNICEDGTIMKVCNKDFIKVSYYDNWDCTGAEVVSNMTKEIQCTSSSYYDNSSVYYWNWKCVNSV